MESKNGNKKSNTEVYARLIISLGFAIFWINSGYDLIRDSGVFSDFIHEHTGNKNSIFTLNSLIFATFYFAILSYPILIVMFLSFTLFDKKGLNELLTKRSFIYFLIFPLSFIGIILILIILKIGTAGIMWILFLGYPVYILLKWIYEEIRN